VNLGKLENRVWLAFGRDLRSPPQFLAWEARFGRFCLQTPSRKYAEDR